MKHRFFLLGSLLLMAIVLAACGGSITTDMPGMNMGASPMPSSQSTTPTKGTMMITVQVTETEFKIDSSMTSFTTGTTYHFVVKNEGSTAHEFMIMPKSEGSMEGMPMGDMETMALASISNLGPGETKTLDYTFPASEAFSHPEFACYLPGHYKAGMKLGVVVKA
jgi:uncharacterized cupredoxin-like copper-binding protein